MIQKYTLLSDIILLGGDTDMVFQKNKLCDTNYNIRMSTDDKARLKAFANELNMPVSYLVRSAINEFYKKMINEK